MKGRVGRTLLWVIGLMLMLSGVIGLFSGPRVIQYAFAPGSEDAVSQMQEAEKRWENVFQPVSVHGITGKVSLATENKTQDNVTLYQVGGNFFQAYPRAFIAGRALAPGDTGWNAAVLDEKLAFVLFGDQDPLGKQVRIGEMVLTVAGVAGHARRIGESGEYAAWIPLKAEGAPDADVMVLTAGGRSAGSAGTMFSSAAQELFGNGSLWDLNKERVRGTIVLFVLFAAMMIRLMVFLSGKLRALCRRWLSMIREKLKTRYPRQMLGDIIFKTAGAVILWAAFVGLGAGLVMLAAELMKMFPEWVPEELLSVSALVRRFWNLTDAAAVPVRWSTPEMAEIRFFSGVVRWGVILFLLGILKMRFHGKHEEEKTVGEQAQSEAARE